MASNILWHYTSLSGALAILQQRTLRASDIRFSNDSREYSAALDVLRDVMHASSAVAPRELESELRTRIDDALSGNRPYSFVSHKDAGYFAACVSEIEDDLGQWRGYAHDGGYALGFDRNLLEVASKEDGFRLAECIYIQDEQRKRMRDVYKGAWQSMEPELEDHRHIAVNRAVAAFFDEFDRLAPVIKDPNFSAEHEWRLVKGPISYDSQSAQSIRFRPGQSMPIPFVELNLSTANAPKTLRCVTVGPSPHMHLAALAIRHAAISSSFAMDNFEVRKTQVPYRGW